MSFVDSEAQRFWPTFMEAWPERLWRHAIPAVAVPLTRDDLLAIVSATPRVARELGIYAVRSVSELLLRELAAKTRAEKPVFVRLGACGWKGDTGEPKFASDAAGVQRILRMPDVRVARLVKAHLDTGRSAKLYLRPFIHIPPLSETRIFVRAGRIVGASQYSSAHAYADVAVAEHHARAVGEFMTRVLPDLHVNDVVVDVGIDAATGRHHVIDLNPLHARSDACLFSWNSDDFDGTFRYRSRGGERRLCATQWMSGTGRAAPPATRSQVEPKTA